MHWNPAFWAALAFTSLFMAAPSSAEAAPRLAFAVIGDSDSHGYQDGVAFPSGSPARGGRFHAGTLQWTEVLQRLRGGEIDLGERVTFGTSGRLSRLLESVGVDARSPRKQDHRHNFAYSGDGCNDLWEGNRQVPRLLRLMKAEPAVWQHGAVLIRIGVNDFGKAAQLDLLARDPAAAPVRASIDACLAGLTQAVSAIRREQPRTFIVLVGIFNNVHWSNYANRWQSAESQARITEGLERFNAGLKRLVAADRQLAFFDDQAWFAALWGGRAPDGKPAYRPLQLGPGLLVTNTSGDHPSNATLADGHAGTAWNAKWAQALVKRLDDSFGVGITPITDDEVRQLVAPSGRWSAP